MHILIIGAGCTGLLIAQGLRKHGISCTVYERSPKDRPYRDWSMMLHWGKKHLQQTLPEDIAERFFKECDTDTYVETTRPPEKDIHVVYNGKTGDSAIELPWGVISRYSRGRAVKVLSEGIDVQYSKKIIDITTQDNGVQAKFEDNTIASGDLLVGADSANSFVRSWLFDHADFAKSSDLPLIVYNFPVSYPNNPGLARKLREMPDQLQRPIIHPDHTTWWVVMNISVQDLDKPEDWIFQMFFTHWNETDKTPETSEERLEHFKKLGETYGEPFREAALGVPEGTNVPYDKLKHWADPRVWDNRGGRITLAGDSAHPFPPHRGQGLNNSMQDAANFVRAVVAGSKPVNGEGKGWEKAMSAYDEEVFERGKQEMEVSVKQAHAATHYEEYLESTAVKFGLKPVPR